jgi:hypothetical protein
MSTWTPIPGFDGYEVTEWGRVRSTDRAVTCSNGRVRRLAGRELRPYRGAGGYLSVYVGGGRNAQPRRVHTLVLTTFVSPAPFPRAHGRHLNGDPLDNWVDNLAWGTAADNARDTVRHGGFPQQHRLVCPRGHLLREPNLAAEQLKRGRRSCRACAQASSLISVNRRNGSKVKHDFVELANSYYARLDMSLDLACSTT